MQTLERSLVLWLWLYSKKIFGNDHTLLFQINCLQNQLGHKSEFKWGRQTTFAKLCYNQINCFLPLVQEEHNWKLLLTLVPHGLWVYVNLTWTRNKNKCKYTLRMVHVSSRRTRNSYPNLFVLHWLEPEVRVGDL